jgi:hypothetical protein
MIFSRRQLLVLPAAAAAAALPARAGLFDPDVRDVEIGSSSNGVLDPKTSRRLRVRSKLRTRDIRWVDPNGRVVDTSTQTLVENNYAWDESVASSTDIWQVTAEDLKAPTRMVLRVRALQEHALAVSLFAGARSARDLDPEIGVFVRASEDASNEWLALFEYDPGVKTFVTVQAQASERVPYRIAVLPAGRFRR